MGTVITTYATLRQSASQEQPQVLTAVDETNLALDKVLGFTVGYYGSVLQVTGDTDYAKSLTATYLNDSLSNIADIKPEWGAVFTLVSLDLSANWFTNASYSAGEAKVNYSLPGLGISGMSYTTSCRLDVQVSNSSSLNQACLSVLKDGSAPVINLGRGRFKFYRYLQPNASWGFEEPSGELTAFANGTYLIGIPMGMGIDASDYMVQVTDTRGIMVAAASFSRITAQFMWNTTTALPATNYVNSSTVNLGSQSNFTAQQYGPDSIYDTLTEGASAPVLPDYYPSSYVLGNSTALVSGELSYVQFDDGVRMIFRSYVSAVSAQTLYAHQETTSIAGTPYYTLRTNASDASGTTLTAQMSSSRVLLGKSVYSLQGISSIPASMWTVNYRAWQDASPAVAFDSASSVETATPATSASWSHTTGSANYRLLVVAVNVHAATGTPTTVTSVTYGGVPLTQVSTALYSATDPQVRTYIFRLVNPASGTNTIAVTFAASTLYACGATTYANVDQTTPIQTSQTATGASTSPSVSVTATGSGRAVFGNLAGHRTAETTTQVTFQAAGGGSGTTGNPTPSYPSGLQSDDLILLQVTVRDTANTPTTPNGFTLLYGPDSTGTGRQWIYYKFATGSESGTITVTIGGSSCKIARMYSFRNVALSSFTEGGGFGSGSSSTLYAQSVTTTDTKRLAVSFVFINDNNAVGSFTGETGGNWGEAVSEYTTSAGSDGCVQLQTATMASAGTISGGSYSMSASDPWGVMAFALKPKTTPPSWVITEGGGQNNRWAKETYLYKGRGSDKLNVAAGPVTMSWSTDYAPNWVCSAVVINPIVPAGHCDIDVLIRKSDNTIRDTIATNVANSGALTSTATTLSGTYSWGVYTVVDQTDYLEVDYYVDVTTITSLNAYLRIDDQSLATSDQTRIEGVMLPSEYTSEVEFIGSSNMASWAQLVWATDSSCTVSGVTVTTQLYNYTAGSYPTSGYGFNSAIIGTSDVAMTQNITVNPENFRNNSTGEWKLKFKAVKTNTTQFDLNIDLVEYSPVPNYMLDIEEQWTNVAYAYPRQDLCIKAGTLGLETLAVDVWHGGAWVLNVAELTGLVDGWKNVSITQYIESSTFKIRFRDSSNSSDPAPDNWDIDAVLLAPQPDIDTLLKAIDHVITVELLQNGTMRWLGQNLQLTTDGKPIPPVPVKAIHVNQTVNGVEQEVPFQVEDWASEYRIPLGLTNNATVFSNKQMIVFLITVNVSKVTIWWNGSDTATQTSKAYTNHYFNDNPSGRTLNNGKMTAQFASTGFTVTSTVGNVTSTASLMRINMEEDTTDPELAYVIVNGTVRDIVQGEAEWGTAMGGGGAYNCPNVYASIVLTLPAKATYYTYQLRLMFIDSTQPRNITNFYPLNLTTSTVITQLQTENGTINGIPIVANGSGSFSSSVWAHHWSQFNSGTQGAGIMFTNASNQQLYVFDPIAGTSTGALRADNSTRVIELLPVSLAPVSFNNALDVAWRGAVVTFDSSAAPVYTLQGTAPSGLWLLVEYPPRATVTSEN